MLQKKTERGRWIPGILVLVGGDPSKERRGGDGGRAREVGRPPFLVLGGLEGRDH